MNKFPTPRWIRTAVLALACLVFPRAAMAATFLDLRNGNLRMTLDEWNGVTLTAGGVNVIRESNLHIVKPGWTGHLLNQREIKPKVSTLSEGNVRVGTAEFDSKAARARYRFEVHPDDVFRMTLTYAMKEPQPAEMEYIAAYLNANLFQGAAFTADTVSGAKSETVPWYATTEDQAKSRVTDYLKRITLQTVIGEVDIQVEGSNELNSIMNLFDARRGRQDWAQANPIFWFGIGVPEIPVSTDEHSVTVTYRFRLKDPGPAENTAAPLPGVVNQDAVRRPHAPDLPVIPHPKETTAAQVAIRPGKRVTIAIPPDAVAEEIAAARMLAREFPSFWAVPAKIVRSASPSVAGSPRIWVGRASKMDAPPEGFRAVRNEQGYWLGVSSQGVCIAGADARGAWYGAQTLRQLVRVDDGGVFIKPMVIRDWPSLRVRGVHWFGGPGGWPFHQAMIDRIVSPLKMNTMLYECQFTQWESQPKIWNPELSSPKADVCKTVDYARKNFLEPIPMVESLGHCEWMFQNGQNKDIVADPDRAYGYDPDNPRSYEVLFGVMEEAIDLFQPKTFHIGHDEVAMWARFPPPWSKKTRAQAFVQDVKTIRDWLKERNIRTMMWGDQMLHYPEDSTDAGWAESVEMAREVRENMPKDVLVNDWHYQPNNPKYPSVELLQKHGYEIIGSPWYEPANIQNFSRVLNDRKATGLIQTEWTGWRVNMDMLNSGAFIQWVGYLLGAEYAWNGGQPGLDDLGYSPDDAFLTLWNRSPVSMAKAAGFTVDLSPSSNTAMWVWAAPGDEPDVSPLPERRSFWNGTLYQTGSPVWLRGALDSGPARPSVLRIPLAGRNASEVHFLWGTTNTASRGTEVLKVTVHYEDGKLVEQPIAYGQEIFAFDDLRSSAKVMSAWRGKTPAGRPAVIRRWAWVNARPDAPIREITVTSSRTEAAPVILGVTGVS